MGADARADVRADARELSLVDRERMRERMQERMRERISFSVIGCDRSAYPIRSVCSPENPLSHENV